MRRWMLVVLAVLTLGLVAVGCGDDDDEGGGGAGAADFETVEEGRLTVGSDIPFAPFEFREGRDLKGLDVDLVEEMARRLELRAKFVDAAFDTIFTQLAAGRYDVVASATTITEERERQVNFTEPYYAAPQALTVNEEETPDIRTTDDLESGQQVAVQAGTTGEDWARENLPDGVDVRSFQDAPDTYTALEAGQVAGVIFDEPSALTEVREREGLEIVQTIDTGERYGFAVDPRNEALLEALDRVLAEMKEDGTYQRIYDRYEDLPPGGSILEAGDS